MKANMQKVRNAKKTGDVLATLQKLPPYCASKLPSTGETILIKRGEPGYHPAPQIADPSAFNDEHGITPAQAEAMFAGSMFGWHVPGADPDIYE